MSSLTVYSGVIFTLLVILQYGGETYGAALPCNDDNCNGSGHELEYGVGQGTGHVINHRRGHYFGHEAGHGAGHGSGAFQTGYVIPNYQHPNQIDVQRHEISDSNTEIIQGDDNIIKKLIDLFLKLNIPISILSAPQFHGHH